MFRFFVYFSSLVILSIAPLRADSPFDLAIPGLQLKLRIDRLEREPGRDINMVYDMDQDSLGFMWFGAEDGLFRYDGYEFRLIDDAHEGQRSGPVRTIFIDNGGTLWFGTTRGTFGRCEPATLLVRTYGDNPSDSVRWSGGWVNALFKDSSGSLWIGTQDRGLWRFDPGTGHYLQFTHDPASKSSLSSNRVQALAETPDHRSLMIGTDHGFDLLDIATENISRVMDPFLSSQDIHSIYTDTFGDIWIGTAGKGVFCISDAPPGQRTARSVASDLYVRSMFRQDARHLWLATDAGLQVLDLRSGKIISFVHDDQDPLTVSSDLVRSVFVDRTGTMWLGTQKWLNKVMRRAWNFEFPQYVVPWWGEPGITEAFSDSTGDLWLGGNFPLRRIAQGGRVRDYRLQPGRPVGDEFNSVILRDRMDASKLWIGTWGDGVKRLDETTGAVEHFRWAPDGRDNNLVYSMYQDSRGILWVGELKGLVRFDPRSPNSHRRFVHRPDDPTSLSSDRIRVVFEGEDSQLWIGTEFGFNKYQKESESFIRYYHDPGDPQSLPSSFVKAVYLDSRGVFWVGTDAGLCVMNRKTGTFESVDPGAGIPTSRIQRIIEDRKGELWFGTWTAGLVNFSPDEVRARVFDTRDGFRSNQLSLGASVLPDGRLAFASNGGLTLANSEAITETAQPPPVQIVSFKVRDREQSLLSEPYEFPYDENFVTIGFVALDFSDPAGNRFQYRLGGSDEEWLDLGNEHSVRFPALQPRSYTFRVRGAAKEGGWNEAASPVSFTIRPPFWETWWFRISGVLVIGTAAFSVYRYRVKKIIEMERLRLNIASDLHDDVGSSLSNIALISDVLRTKSATNPEADKDLQEISNHARRTADALRDIVWVMNPDNEGSDNLLLHMKDIANSMLRNLEVSFSTIGHVFAKPPDLKFRRNLILIYKEMLHNIVKHSQATKVTIILEENNDKFRLRVEDNGVGFDETKVTRGNGLKTMRRRAEEMGGRVEWVPKPPRTQIIFQVINT